MNAKTSEEGNVKRTRRKVAEGQYLALLLLNIKCELGLAESCADPEQEAWQREVHADHDASSGVLLLRADQMPSAVLLTELYRTFPQSLQVPSKRVTLRDHTRGQ
jgi:hypothetical protein